MEFAKIAAGLDLPRGILNVVTGGGARLGEALAKSPLTDMVSLTGSVEAGQRIITAGAANITKVSLELGGKAPAIVCADGLAGDLQRPGLQLRRAGLCAREHCRRLCGKTGQGF